MTTGITTTSDGVELAWDRRGSGTPVVLVHGITDNRSSLEPIADRLAGTHEVLSLDLRGHGQSTKGSDYAIERLAGDVVEVVADQGLESPALVGHSLGAMVATAAAAHVGARAVVNVDQPLALGSMAGVVAELADGLRNPDTFHATLGAFFDAFESPSLDAASTQAFRDGVANVDPSVVLGIWGPMLDGPDPAVDELVDAVLASVTMPYLAIHGMDPGPDYSAWLAERIPHSVLEVHPGVGHFVHLVDVDAFVQRIAPVIV